MLNRENWKTKPAQIVNSEHLNVSIESKIDRNYDDDNSNAEPHVVNIFMFLCV